MALDSQTLEYPTERRSEPLLIADCGFGISDLFVDKAESSHANRTNPQSQIRTRRSNQSAIQNPKSKIKIIQNPQSGIE